MSAGLPGPSVSPQNDRVDGRLVALCAVAIGLACLLGELAPSPSRSVAVISWPWQTSAAAARTVIGAGGVLETASADGHVVIATAPFADFAQRLYSGGAALVIDARLIAGCQKTIEKYQ